MLSLIRNLFVNGGVDQAAFADAREELVEKNRRTLVFTGALFAVLFLGLFMSAFAETTSDTLGALRQRSRVLYAGIFVLCALVVLGVCAVLPRHRRLVLPACYGFMGILFATAIYISTFNQPYYPGTTFCVFLVVLPLLVIDRPYRLVLFVSGVCVAYLVCSHLCKSSELFTVDLLNCACFFYLSLTVGLLVQNLRINEVVQRKVVERQRDRDGLTGLLNREAFERDARDAILRDGACAILFMDIDNFKQINDTCGHVYGDAVIRAVGECIGETLPGHTVAGRYGGDEFILCLGGAANACAARDCAEMLQKAIRDRIALPGHTGSVTVSIGICMSSDGVSYDELVRRADDAVYRAKALGKDQCCVSVG